MNILSNTCKNSNTHSLLPKKWKVKKKAQKQNGMFQWRARRAYRAKIWCRSGSYNACLSESKAGIEFNHGESCCKNSHFTFTKNLLYEDCLAEELLMKDGSFQQAAAPTYTLLNYLHTCLICGDG